MQDIYDIFDHKETFLESIKYFPARTWYKVKNIYYEIKYKFERLFRGYSDFDVFEMYSSLTHIILPRLIAFRKDLHGFPVIFSEWDAEQGKYGGMGMTKEEYDQKIIDGEFLPGGIKAWEEILDKMIFAFTFILVEDSYPRNKFERKLVKDFKEKYGDIDAKKPENAHKNEYHFLTHKDKGSMHCPEENYTEEEKNKLQQEGWEYQGFKQRPPFYYDYKLEQELNDKCNEGLQLFGKHFRSLWD